ncbi:unnamed protein product [Calypogeia fissa]
MTVCFPRITNAAVYSSVSSARYVLPLHYPSCCICMSWLSKERGEAFNSQRASPDLRIYLDFGVLSLNCGVILKVGKVGCGACCKFLV